MAKQSGLGDNFYYNGYDLSGDLSSVDTISGPLALLNSTGINQYASARIPGLRSGAMSFTSFFESAGVTNAPAVPLTTVPLVNPYNWPVLVTVTGGTVTNVSVNGATVGTVPGTYTLPSPGTITLTYSSAPTWTWLAVGTEHNALKLPIPSADSIASYIRGAAIGNVACCMVSHQTDYDPTRDTTGDLTFKVDLVADGYGVEWGYQLTPGLRIDTAPTVGPVRDDGAATLFGAQAYLQLVELIGTNVDVTVTHSTTSGGTYTTLIDFGSQTSIGAVRGSTANNATVNEFLKVATTGTFTYAQFAVVFNRNPIAGVIF
jgi:hypothetical protein